MTVHSLETAQKVVEEIGPSNIEAVFSYIQWITKDTLFAVFLKGQYIDIYQSPYCSFIKKIFELGKWIK